MLGRCVKLITDIWSTDTENVVALGKLSLKKKIDVIKKFEQNTNSFKHFLTF